MKTTIVAVVMMFFMGTLSAQKAAVTPNNQKTGINKNCPAFVDANKDGICDNLGTYNCPYYGRGQMKNTGRGQGMRNGNGRGMNGMCIAQGTGAGMGRGQGRNFVDANNNGICDTYEKITKARVNTNN